MKKGFTIIELLIVVSIIGLLSSVVLVSMEGAKERADTGKAMEFSHIVRVSLGADLVGEWRLDDESDPTQDSSGYDNHGDLISFNYNADSGWIDNGIFGKALLFDGVDDRVIIGNPANLNDFSQGITLETWMKFSGDPSTNGWGTVLMKGDEWNEGPGFKFGWKSKQIRFQIANSGGKTTRTIKTLSEDTWYHVVGTYDKTKMVGYINGEEEDSCDKTGDLVLNGGSWQLGRDASHKYDGIIDEVRIYNYALSRAEVQQLYVQGANRHGIVLK